jgi:heme exporter protein A
VSEPAIAGVGVAKRFGRAVALRGVDFQAPAAHCLAVLGPNGAGKSTLLRLVAGLARPSAGSITILGRTPDQSVTRAQIGYIGHATLVYPTLTARENLLFAGRMYAVEDVAGRADRLLEEEGLSGVAHRPAGDFSRGMAQRLSIARSLMHDPRVVLLDEPFTGLDRRSAERLQARIASLRDEGRTLLLVSHDVEQAAAVADSSIVLVRGRVALATTGAPDALEVERITAEDAA